MYEARQNKEKVSRTLSSCKKKPVQPILMKNIFSLQQKERHISNLNSISIQRQIPTQINENPKPTPVLAKPYNPHGKRIRVSPTMPRPTWQEGYRDTVLQQWFSTSNKDEMVTDVVGKTVPLWAIELDHRVSWDDMKNTMVEDGRYFVHEAKLYFHDISNLQPLNSYDNKMKSNSKSPDYSVPHLNMQLGNLPNIALKSVSELVFDFNNVAPFVNENCISQFSTIFKVIIFAVNECRNKVLQEELFLDTYDSE